MTVPPRKGIHATEINWDPGMPKCRQCPRHQHVLKDGLCDSCSADKSLEEFDRLGGVREGFDPERMVDRYLEGQEKAA